MVAALALCLPALACSRSTTVPASTDGGAPTSASADVTVAADPPPWVADLARRMQQGVLPDPPSAGTIWQYQYNSQTVYYVPPRCCDLPSVLFDANGNVLCSPDGGFGGHGDGRCDDFFEKRKAEKLIWRYRAAN
jgi:hypothetical protein